MKRWHIAPTGRGESRNVGFRSLTVALGNCLKAVRLETEARP